MQLIGVNKKKRPQLEGVFFINYFLLKSDMVSSFTLELLELPKR